MLSYLTKQGDTRAYTAAQVRFHEVSEAELESQRELFRTGRMQIKIEDIEFSMRYAHIPSALVVCWPWHTFVCLGTCFCLSCL